MKRILTILLAAVFLLTACGQKEEAAQSEAQTGAVSLPAAENSEMRAVWISYTELSMKSEQGGTAESFSEKIEVMLRRVKDFGLNTVIVHVRPFSDAFYPSVLFPYSAYLTGTQGAKINYDPFKIITEQAKALGLSVHAWINPYRVLLENDFSKLSDDNPAKIWYTENPKDERLIVLDSGIYYNPASEEVQKLIIDGVRELIQNYAIDGIHMDDYFYPTTDPSVDKIQYERYRAGGGKLSLGDWRRENVSGFVSGLYAAIKAKNPNVLLGISPTGDIRKNFSVHYADTARWGKEAGFADYLMPQLYYGFENQTKPFAKMAEEWSETVTHPMVSLYFGLAAYKCDTADAYAGTGSGEWQKSTDILARQLQLVRTLKGYAGFSLFSFGYLFSEKRSENVKKECENLKDVLQYYQKNNRGEQK